MTDHTELRRLAEGEGIYAQRGLTAQNVSSTILSLLDEVERLREALGRIAKNETEVFDEAEQAMVSVPEMGGEEMSQLAYVTLGGMTTCGFQASPKQPAPEKGEVDDWIIELEGAAESLMGIAGAIQNGKLEGRQDQCYRTRDSLIRLEARIRAALTKEPSNE